MIKIKMIKNSTGSINGYEVLDYIEGNIYELPSSRSEGFPLGTAFIKKGVAVAYTEKELEDADVDVIKIQSEELTDNKTTITNLDGKVTIVEKIKNKLSIGKSGVSDREDELNKLTDAQLRTMLIITSKKVNKKVPGVDCMDKGTLVEFILKLENSEEE